VVALQLSPPHLQSSEQKELQSWRGAELNFPEFYRPKHENSLLHGQSLSLRFAMSNLLTVINYNDVTSSHASQLFQPLDVGLGLIVLGPS